MSTSRNGFTVIKPNSGGLWSLPWVTGSVMAGAVWVVFNWLGAQYNRRVEPIRRAASWGYAYRVVRGGSSWSNHASGTAVDFNADAHPFRTAASASFTSGQIATCDRIVAESGDVLKWLSGHDPMHWEIRPGVTLAQVEAFATRLLQDALGVPVDGVRGDVTVAALKAFQAAHGLDADGVDGPATWAALAVQPAAAPATPANATPATTAPSVTAPAFPLPAGSYFGPRYPLSNTRSVSGYYSHREDLRRWQQRMADRGWKITADGYYGDETERVATAFQRQKGLQVDGLIGPATWAAAWTAPVTND